MLTRADSRRRWFGALFLVLAGGMLIWGRMVLNTHLHGWVFLCYWLACFLFTGLAMLVALLDIRAVRRHLAEEQQTLFRQAFGEHPSPPNTESGKPKGEESKNQ